jgi:predicted ester cyclase
MTETDEVKLNDINEEGLIDHSSKNKSLNNQIVVYSLFAVTMILIIGGVILLLLSLRVKDQTKENAELVTKFFKDGYEYKNFDKVMTYMSDNYYDHSPASARSNADAVNILKSVANSFSDVKVEMLDLTCEKDMVAARLLFKVVHTGEYNGIPATGKTITYEALENFKVVNGIIVESWGYWPDKQIEEKLKAN